MEVKTNIRRKYYTSIYNRRKFYLKVIRSYEGKHELKFKKIVCLLLIKM